MISPADRISKAAKLYQEGHVVNAALQFNKAGSPEGGLHSFIGQRENLMIRHTLK